MVKLAEASGIVVYEEGNNLFINSKPAQWTTTFLFVVGLLTFIFLTNGVLQLFIFNMPTPGIILTVIGIVFALVFWRVMMYRKKINSTPPEKLRSVCIFDLSANMLLDSEQNILSPLDSVRMVRKMQFGSSSPALVLQWSNGSLTLVKGNPFSGGISAIEKVLISKLVHVLLPTA